MASEHRLLRTHWWSALTRRYQGIQGGLPAVYLSPVVSPVIDLDRLLDRVRILNKTISPGANGALTYFTVPAGKAWELIELFIPGNATGTYTYQVTMYDGPTATGAKIRQDTSPNTAATAFYTNWPVGRLGPGFVVALDITAWAADGAGSELQLWLREYDVHDNRVALPAA